MVIFFRSPATAKIYKLIHSHKKQETSHFEQTRSGLHLYYFTGNENVGKVERTNTLYPGLIKLTGKHCEVRN